MSTIRVNALAIAAALTALAIAPQRAQAQSPASSQRPAASAPAAAPLTRAEVSAEVQRAMRDGTWRCATNNRGWCGITPSDQGVARNPRSR